MSDNSISGLYRILPTYPVKPPQPADREREDEHRRHPPPPARRSDDDEDDADDKPAIDEYV